jgi:hypothetical protein
MPRGTPSAAGKKRRQVGVPVDAKALRALQGAGKDSPEDHARRVFEKVLARQGDIFTESRALLVGSVPKVVRNIVGIAEGRAGRSSDQVAAAKLVLEWARFPAAGSGDIGAPGANLSEMPLDQLESALSGVLDRVRTLRAIDGQSQSIDDAGLHVPDDGTGPSDSAGGPAVDASPGAGGPAAPPAPPDFSGG